MSSETTFTHIRNYGDLGPSQQLKFGLMEFLDWGFLNIGAYINVHRPASGLFGGQFSRLYPAINPTASSCQYWQAAHSNWVWESGLEYGSPQPVTGVFVNNVFYPSNTVGTYAHRVDYNLGRIVFNSPIATSSRVEASYSYKVVNVIDNDHPWFREITFDSFRPDKPDFIATSGDWFMIADQRMQLPAVVVEVNGNDQLIGDHIGDLQQKWRPEVNFHIFSANATDRDIIKDTILFQKDKTLRLYNRNAVSDHNDFPLTIDGSLASGAKTYPQMLSAYYYNQVYFDSTNSRQLRAVWPHLFSCTVTARMEMRVPPV